MINIVSVDKIGQHQYRVTVSDKDRTYSALCFLTELEKGDGNFGIMNFEGKDFIKMLGRSDFDTREIGKIIKKIDSD